MPPPERPALALRAALGDILIRFGMPLVGVGLLTAGLLGIVSYAALPAIDALRSRDWQPVEASVESVDLRLPQSRFHPALYSVAIRYRYKSGGIEHDGARFDPHDGMYARPVGADVLAGLRSARHITVWVNPADPDEAMVHRELRWPVLLFALPALVLALVGGLMLFAGMLAWSQDKMTWRRRKADSP